MLIANLSTALKFVISLLLFYGLLVVVPVAAYAQAAPAAADQVKLGLVAILVFGARQLAEILAKLIPDSATGVGGVIRQVFKLAALYVPNKS